MFSGQLLPFFDPRKFADQGLEMKGQASVGELPRLADFRGAENESVDVALQFGRNEDGKPSVEGTVSAHLTMPCQRCLEPVTYQVTASVNLVMVWTEEQMKALPEHQEGYMVSADEKMPLSHLLEEELLLAAPLVAMHEQCPNPLVKEQDSAADDVDKADNPFAVLAKLKSQQE
jgi:DUF177 domain-containing protein